MAFDVNKALELLVCPQSHARLVYDSGAFVSTDPRTRRRYRIVDEIPVMLVDESEQLSESAWQEVMRRHGQLADNGHST